jgi:hypothetical protein
MGADGLAHRWRLDAHRAVLSPALFNDHRVPVAITVPRGWLDLIPAADHPLGPPDGVRPEDVSTINGQYFVRSGADVRRVSMFRAYVDTQGRPPTSVSSVPQSFRDADEPELPSGPVGAMGAAVCARWQPSGRSTTVTLGRERHTPVAPTTVRPAPDDTVVVVVPGSGSLVRASRTRHHGTDLWLVADDGRPYEIEGEDTLAHLGYDGSSVPHVPTAWLDLLGQHGPTLSARRAACDADSGC